MILRCCHVSFRSRSILIWTTRHRLAGRGRWKARAVGRLRALSAHRRVASVRRVRASGACLARAGGRRVRRASPCLARACLALRGPGGPCLALRLALPARSGRCPALPCVARGGRALGAGGRAGRQGSPGQGRAGRQAGRPGQGRQKFSLGHRLDDACHREGQGQAEVSLGHRLDDACHREGQGQAEVFPRAPFGRCVPPRGAGRPGSARAARVRGFRV